MSQALYVGNLAWEVTDDDLFNLCVEYQTNPVSAQIVFGRTGRSQGYGLVSFNSEEDANNAVAQLNELEYQGRNIVVREDRGTNVKAERKPRNTEPVTSGLSLYVGNLSWSTSEEAIAQEFAQFNATEVSLKFGRDGRSRGYAIVSFETEAEAQAALEVMNGATIDERELKCRFDEGAGLKYKKSPDVYTEPKSSTAAPPTPNTLYIGNLPWEVTDDDLFKFFVDSNTNPVSAGVVYTRSGRSQGYALVSFNSEEEAANAIEQVNEVEFQGRNIVARMDRGTGVKTERRPKVEREQVVNELALFVGNLSWSTTEEAIAQEFAQFNPAEVSLKFGRDGRSRGYAIVSFASSDEAQAALEAMNGFVMDEREIKCRFDSRGN